MTKEQVITRIKHSSMYKDDRETADYIIKALEQQPSDYVSMGVYKQVAWERDVAIEQLKELGYSFGEKIRTCDDCVSRQAIDQLCYRFLSHSAHDIAFYEHFCNLPSVTPTRKVEKWIGEEEGYYSECSCCGASFLWEDYKCIGDWKYCPKCGAEITKE